MTHNEWRTACGLGEDDFLDLGECPNTEFHPEPVRLVFQAMDPEFGVVYAVCPQCRFEGGRDMTPDERAKFGEEADA